MLWSLKPSQALMKRATNEHNKKRIIQFGADRLIGSYVFLESEMGKGNRNKKEIVSNAVEFVKTVFQNSV